MTTKANSSRDEDAKLKDLKLNRIASCRTSEYFRNKYTRFLAVLGGGFFLVCFCSPFAAAQNLNVTVDTVLDSGTYSYSDVVVANSAKLILNGNVTLSANNVTVDSGAAITADGKGYSGGQGPGAGGSSSSRGSGGGYGGMGGATVVPPPGGGIYGSAARPVDLGSGGGGFVCSFPSGPVHSGGTGGGSIRLEISGVLTVNGSIASNGGATITACDGRSGGGSGGSIYITTDSITGTGGINAKGGPGGPSRGGGGGGGRIAVYYKNWNFSGAVDASGGLGVTELGVSGTGKKGTVGLFDATNNDFYAGKSWRFQENDSPFEFNKVVLDHGSVVETEKNISLSASNMVLNNGSVLFVNEDASFSVKDVLVSGNSTVEGNFKISAVNLTLAQGAKISANAKGYSGGQGLGAGLASQFGGSGGGYGGRGGAGGLISSGGLPYGSPTAPVDFGSGGDGPGFTVNNVVFPSSGGPGGGKIQMTIANTLTVDGSISTNGGNALPQGSQAGGGAGGSIYIITEKFAGSGSITANGGQSGPTGGGAAGGGGGGGRIAVFHRQPSAFTGSVNALGGLGVGQNGENGSVVLLQSQLAVYPNRGGDTGSVTVTISGSVFFDGSTVKLVRSGQPDIVGESLKLSDNGIRLTATFNLAGQARGDWDLVVTHPDGSSISLPNGFTIEEGRAPELWVDVIGQTEIRLGREQQYWIAYGNRGNVDVFGSHLFLGIPNDTEYKLESGSVMVTQGEGVVDDVFVAHLASRSVDIMPITAKVLLGVGNLEFNATISNSNQSFRFEHSVSPRPIPNNALQSLALSQDSTVGDYAQPILQGRTEAPAGYIDYNIINDPEFGEFGEISIRLSNNNLAWSYPVIGVEIRPFSDLKNGILILNKVFDGNGNPCPSPGECGTKIVIVKNVFAILPGSKENMPTIALQMEQEIQSRLGSEFCNPTSNKPCAPNTFSCVGLADNAVYPNGTPFGKEGELLTTDDYIKEWIKVNGGEGRLLRDAINNSLLNPTWFDWWISTRISFRSAVVNSRDPNSKIGPQGIGQLRFVSGKEPLHYATFFENVETATAPAQEVVITDQFDPAKMDLSTFSLGPISFGDKLVIPPSGLKEYITEVDLRPENNLIVRVEARLDMATGIVTWQFLSLDPQTKKFTSDPLAGFLPPNVNPPEGDGSVVFTVMPQKGLPTGTAVLNKAAIVFDVNDPIETPEWFNLLDNTKPQSAVNLLPSRQEHRNFEVSWTGTDEGAGIKNYTIFVSEDDGPFTVWLADTTALSAIFTGEDGKTYSFYSVARDLVGNIEDATLFGDTTTTVLTNAPPQANAGEDQTIECRSPSGTMVVLDGSGSSDIDGDTLTYIWSGSFPEGNGTVTGVNPAITLPLGTHTIVLTVNDGKGGIDTDEVAISIEDTLPPVITAQWVPLQEGKDKKFRVEFSAADLCDLAPEVIGVIETPSVDGLEVKLEREDEIRIKFDLKKKKLDIHAPDPNAILNQLQTYGGAVIPNGQLTKVKTDDDHKDKKQEYELEDGWLKIKAPAAVLKVISEDASGNKAEVRVSPEISDDKDDHDKK